MDSQRIALETEEQGADILRSLRGQREQIQNARDTVSFWFLISAFYGLSSAFYGIFSAVVSVLVTDYFTCRWV